MDVGLAFLFGLFFLVTVKGDVRRVEPKTCEPKSNQDTEGSLDQLVGNLFPCNVEPETQQQIDENEDGQISEAPQPQSQHPSYPQDSRYNQQRSEDIALSVFDLSQRLMESIVKESSKKFEIVSPMSIASALHLALLGANGMTFNELMDVMEYNTKTYSYYPYQIHEEFGFLLEDMATNSPNPARFRPKVPWRLNASKEYEKKAMRFQSNQPNYNEHKISVANGIFVQRDFSIRTEYTDVVQNVYHSEIQSLDFRRDPQKSAKVINDWVNEKTNGKIKEIIAGSANPETRVILANALYFSAEWQETFINGATQWKKFYPNGTDNDYSVMVELMAHGGKFPHYYDLESDCDILGIPYKQNATTMYVIMPKQSSAQKIREAQKVLTAEKIEKIISRMVIKTAVILFPKMHLSCGHQLKSKLQDLGMRTIFEPRASDMSVMSDGVNRYSNGGSYPLRPPAMMNLNEELIFGRMDRGIDIFFNARNRTKRDVAYKTVSEAGISNPLTVKDFMLRKRIVKKGQDKKLKRNKRQSTPFSAERLDSLRHRKDLKNPHLYADEVIHKVDLVINEKGTEAGAATAITLNRSGPNLVFRVDVPFIFLIRHDPTHIPLFYGVVFEPQN